MSWRSVDGNGNVLGGYPIEQGIIRDAAERDPMGTCRGCAYHSEQDACCCMTGETKRSDDPACRQRTDGWVDGNRKESNE